MCVEGLGAIPLGCSDCYDKNNVPEAMHGGLSKAGSGGWAGAGQGQGPGGQGLTGSACCGSRCTGLRNGSLPQNNCSPNT